MVRQSHSHFYAMAPPVQVDRLTQSALDARGASTTEEAADRKVAIGGLSRVPDDLTAIGLW